MSKFLVGPLVAVGLFSGFTWASGPQSAAQLYELQSSHKGQVVMLSRFFEDRRFSTYEESADSAKKYFPAGTRVWIWCAGKSDPNQITEIDASGYGGWTTVDLTSKLSCTTAPLLMSNYEFPKQKWTAKPPSQTAIQQIQKKLNTKSKLEITQINTQKKGTFYLVFDPERGDRLYDDMPIGESKLLDSALIEISAANRSFKPLIDLDNDSVPEFYLPSDDGEDAWIYRLFPKKEEDCCKPH